MGVPADPTHTRNTLSSLYEHEARKDIMSHSEYHMHMHGLNDGQWAIVMYNHAWCKKSVINLWNGLPLNGYKIYLGGPGGTGKSHVIKLICWDVIYFLQQLMGVQPDEPLVLLTAPTGLAAFNIGGVTLHSAFMLKTNSGETSSWEKQLTMQLKLANLALCVIDEISMVGGSTFAKISETLKRIKQNTDDWGHVAVLAIGDFYQLPPVGQRPVYKRLKTIHAPGDMAPLLWDDFCVHDLNEVMCQKDVDFAHALNRIHKGPPDAGSPDDLMLHSRELHISHTDALYPVDAMHVYAWNEHCTYWNNIRLNTLAGDLYSHVAIDVPQDQNTNLATVVFPDNPKDTGHLLKVVNVKIGARVMLTNNIDVADVLTNGAMGTVSAVVTKSNGSLHVILVQFDSDWIGSVAQSNSKYKHVDINAVPIGEMEVSFGFMDNTYVRVSRTQFPFFLCWAVTIHKCQGMTLPQIVVDMSPNKGTFKNGQAYVAFS